MNVVVVPSMISLGGRNQTFFRGVLLRCPCPNPMAEGICQPFMPLEERFSSLGRTRRALGLHQLVHVFSLCTHPAELLDSCDLQNKI